MTRRPAPAIALTRVALRRTAALIAAGAVGIGALAGCAAGQVSQTAQQAAAVEGGSGNTRYVAVLDATFAAPDGPHYPAGSDLPLQFTVANDAAVADSLTAITTPAGQVSLAEPIAIPAGGAVAVGPNSKVKATLSKVSAPVYFGQPVPLTLTFANAGAITVNAVVAQPAERTGERPTVNILPPHPTPIWQTGHAGEH